MLLRDLAREKGYSSTTFSFPRYDSNPFSRGVAAYLNGTFGSANSVSPYLSALLYAGDRFTARASLLAARDTSDIVFIDRYVDSNIAHQASKLVESERSSFISWIEEVEYGVYGLPRADETIFLQVPTQEAARLVARKAARNYTDLAADIHEADEEYLQACAGVYLWLVERKLPGSHAVAGYADGAMRNPLAIRDESWRHIQARMECIRSDNKGAK